MSIVDVKGDTVRSTPPHFHWEIDFEINRRGGRGRNYES